MDWEALIMGVIAVIWGVVLCFVRPQILDFAREGGKGLRNRSILNVVVIAATALLLGGGSAVIMFMGL